MRSVKVTFAMTRPVKCLMNKVTVQCAAHCDMHLAVSRSKGKGRGKVDSSSEEFH